MYLQKEYPTRLVGHSQRVELMLVPATASGSPDVNGKEHIVTTPEPSPPSAPAASATTSWRDIVQSGADHVQIEGFALEHLIDLQRDRERKSGAGR